MKDSGKDKFEQFFQDSLKDYNSNPSDDLWSELEHQIPPPPKSSIYKKMGGWMFLFFAIVLLSTTILWQQYENKIENINQTLKTQDQKITSITNELKGNNLEKENISTEESEESLKEIGLTKDISKTSKFNEIIEGKREKNIFDKIIINKTEIEKVNAKDVGGNKNVDLKNVNTLLNSITQTSQSTQPIENFSVTTPHKEEETKTDFSTIAIPESISSLDVFLDHTDPSLDFYRDFETLNFGTPKVKNSVEFYNNNGWVLPNMTTTDFTVESTNLSNRFFDLGVLYGIRLTDRVLLQLGISYGGEQTGIQFQKTFKYAEDEVFVNNNLTQTKFVYLFTSNYRKQKIDFFILNEKQNDGDDVVANDPFTMNIQIKRRQRFFTAPVILKYFLGKKNQRLSGSLKIGFFQKVSFLENELSEVNVKDISHPRLFHNRTLVTQIGFQRTKNLSYLLGAGVEYKLNSRSTLIIEPTFQKTIFGLDEILPYNLGVHTGLRLNLQ